MEEVAKITAFGLAAACLCISLRNQMGPFAMTVSLTACIGILLIGIRFFSPILGFLDRLRDLSGLADATTVPVFKVMGIGILSQITASICEDSGESALARAVEFGCSILAVYVSIPLMSSVLDLLEQLLGGIS